MSLAELLRDRGIRTVLIVDDAYDATPRAQDIGPGNAQWDVFGDDWTEETREAIAELYAGSRGRRLDDLRDDDLFVAALWTLREQFPALLEPLFQGYIGVRAADLRHVDEAQRRLEALGLEVRTAGRNFADAAGDPDLILIDLYLGHGQGDADLQASKDLLRQAIETRGTTAPLVILMSRSSHLEAKRDEFRDEVGLLDSGFRIISKSDLESGDRLERQIERLATHLDDTRKLAAFVDALAAGLDGAAQRTLTRFRRLRLSDLGQIQSLLLDAEGEPTGSYLVDVFDRVFAHELEAAEGIIDAAKTLNGFSASTYPPPYVAGSPGLQDLVARTLTQNAERLQLPGSTNGLVTFGDILQPSAGETEEVKRTLLVDVEAEQVLLVMTPVCDLQRNGAPRILLMVGDVRPFGLKDWTYGSDARTVCIELGGEHRWIKWDPKHIDTVSWDQLARALESGELSVVARLRESHALELQQKLLSGLGRVGQLAPMPASFPVDIDVFTAGLDGRPERLEVPTLNEGAVCFVGRDDRGKPAIRLVMTEGAWDGVEEALGAVDRDRVHQMARRPFDYVRSQPELRQKMAKGLRLDGVGAKWSGVASDAGVEGMSQMALIGWNLPEPQAQLGRGDWGKAGLIFHIRDKAAAETLRRDEAVRDGLLPPDPPATPSGDNNG